MKKIVMCFYGETGECPLKLSLFLVNKNVWNEIFHNNFINESNRYIMDLLLSIGHHLMIIGIYSMPTKFL